MEQDMDFLTTAGTSQDRHSAPAYDTVPPSGPLQEVSDDVIDRALANLTHVQNGGHIEAVRSPQIPLSTRIQEGVYGPVDDDSYEIPRDQSGVHEDVLFKDVDEEPDIDVGDDDPDDTDEPSFVPSTEIETPGVSDKTQWIMDSLKIIHADVQQIKVKINNVADVNNKIDEVQSVIAHVMTEFVDMKNVMSNMEMTIAKNRVDIAKLTDLVKSAILAKPSPQPVAAPPKIPPTTRGVEEKENNLDMLVLSLSKGKSLSANQETTIRNMLLSHDKNIIRASLDSIGVVRPIMSIEIDKLVQLDIGSSQSLQGVLKILQDVIKPVMQDVVVCEGPCSTPRYPARPPLKKPLSNPFKMRK